MRMHRWLPNYWHLHRWRRMWWLHSPHLGRKLLTWIQCTVGDPCTIVYLGTQPGTVTCNGPVSDRWVYHGCQILQKLTLFSLIRLKTIDIHRKSEPREIMMPEGWPDSSGGIVSECNVVNWPHTTSHIGGNLSKKGSLVGKADLG